MSISNPLKNFNNRTNYMFGHKYLVTFTDTDYLEDKEKDKKYKTHVMGFNYGDAYQFSELSRNGVEDKTRILELINCISVKIPEIKKEKKEWKYGNGGTFMMIPKYDKSNLELTFYETLDGTVMNLITKYFRDQYGYHKDPSVAEYYKTTIPEPATRKPIKEIKVYVYDNIGNNAIKCYIFKDCHIDSYNHYNMSYTSNAYVNINLSISYEYFEVNNYGNGLNLSGISRTRFRNGMIDRNKTKGIESNYKFKTDATKNVDSSVMNTVNALSKYQQQLKQKRKEDREEANKVYVEKTTDKNLHTNDDYGYKTFVPPKEKYNNELITTIAANKIKSSKDYEYYNSLDMKLTYKLATDENSKAINERYKNSVKNKVEEVITNGYAEKSQDADRRLIAATSMEKAGDHRYISTGIEDLAGNEIQIEIDQQRVEDAIVREDTRSLMTQYGETDDVNIGMMLENKYATSNAVVENVENKMKEGKELTAEETRAYNAAKNILGVMNGEFESGKGKFGQEQIDELHNSSVYKNVVVYSAMEDLGVNDFHDNQKGKGGNKTDTELSNVVKGYFNDMGVKNPTKDQINTAVQHYRATRTNGERSQYDDGSIYVDVFNGEVTTAKY